MPCARGGRRLSTVGIGHADGTERANLHVGDRTATSRSHPGHIRPRTPPIDHADMSDCHPRSGLDVSDRAAERRAGPPPLVRRHRCCCRATTATTTPGAAGTARSTHARRRSPSPPRRPTSLRRCCAARDHGLRAGRPVDRARHRRRRRRRAAAQDRAGWLAWRSTPVSQIARVGPGIVWDEVNQAAAAFGLGSLAGRCAVGRRHRLHARRWDGLALAPVRLRRRPRAPRRPRHGRRPPRAGERRRARRPVLGASGRRRQLRHRDRVGLSAVPGADDLGRPVVLPRRAGGARLRRLPGLGAERTRRDEHRRAGDASAGGTGGARAATRPPGARRARLPPRRRALRAAGARPAARRRRAARCGTASPPARSPPPAPRRTAPTCRRSPCASTSSSSTTCPTTPSPQRPLAGAIASRHPWPSSSCDTGAARSRDPPPDAGPAGARTVPFSVMAVAPYLGPGPRTRRRPRRPAGRPPGAVRNRRGVPQPAHGPGPAPPTPSARPISATGARSRPTWDPDNVLRLHHNIPPAAPSGVPQRLTAAPEPPRSIQ